MMRTLVINNLKVLGVHVGMSILGFLIMLLAIAVVESLSWTELGTVALVLCCLLFLVGFYLSGRFLLGTTGNLLKDCGSFVLIIALALLCLLAGLGPASFLIWALFMPSQTFAATFFFLGAFSLELNPITWVFIMVFISILLQLLGLARGNKVRSRTQSAEEPLEEFSTTEDKPWVPGPTS